MKNFTTLLLLIGSVGCSSTMPSQSPQSPQRLQSSKFDASNVELSCAEKGFAKLTSSSNNVQQQGKYRSETEIRIVLNCETEYFNNLYDSYVKRGMKKGGNSVFRIVISPDGAVSSVVVVRSDLKNRKFLNDMMVNIAVLDFQKRDVLETDFEYAIKFM